MGVADRDYHRNRPQGGGFLSHLPPVVRGLLLANTGIFFLDYLVLARNSSLQDPSGFPPLLEWGAFSVQSAILEFRVWEFVTFQFLHGSLGHLLFNCIGLYFFGPWMERWWGSRKFLWFYLLCGAAGAAFFTLLLALGIVPGNFQSPIVGASAGIYGIFIGVAVIAPNLRVMLLFPPVELSMRQLAVILMAIATGIILLGLFDNEGGEAGHLGGAILGFLLVKYPRLLGVGDMPFFRSGRQRRSTDSKLRPRTSHLSDDDDEVDAILDKISRDGFQSLTDAEREVLRKASERKHHDS